MAKLCGGSARLARAQLSPTQQLLLPAVTDDEGVGAAAFSIAMYLRLVATLQHNAPPNWLVPKSMPTHAAPWTPKSKTKLPASSAVAEGSAEPPATSSGEGEGSFSRRHGGLTRS